MMQCYNEFNFTFANSEVATESFEKIKDCINNLSYSCLKQYRADVKSEILNHLSVVDNMVYLQYYCYLYASDAKDYFFELLKAVCREVKADFTFTNKNNDTYEDSYIDAEFKDGTLEVAITFYPEGYTDIAECEDCGAEVIEFDDWDGSYENMQCPECGNIVDLEDIFAVREWVNNYTIHFDSK